jgi:hypothetical protein
VHVLLFYDPLDFLASQQFLCCLNYKQKDIANMTDIQNVDAGNKVDLERVFGLGFITVLVWKRRAITQ